MYVVIFKATFAAVDEKYSQLAKELRQRALEKFGCVRFESATEGNFEIALSYWNSLDDIKRWKLDLKHQQAQHQGQTLWYQHYQVEIAEIGDSYQSAEHS